MSERSAGLRRLLAIVGAPLSLAAARARRRPGRWLAAAAGIALATAFAAALAGEATIAGDGAARRALAGLSATERAVRVIRPNVASPAVDRAARRVLDRLGLGAQTRVVLLNPVRLGETVVRIAAIDPVGRWVSPRPPRSASNCNARDCPLLLAGPPRPPATLRSPGVRLRVVGDARLRSAEPLGYVPRAGAAAGSSQQTTLLVGGDAAGLDRLGGLGGIYRTDTWSAELPTSTLHSWDLSGLRSRLEQANSRLVGSGSQFSIEAPFRGLARAQAQADSAPRRLLLVAGGGLAALAAFVVLVAGALRRNVASELARMRTAGATRGQRALFALGEAAVPSAAGVVVGFGAGVAATAVLAASAGAPVGAVLAHSLLTPLAIAVAVGGFAVATVLLAALLLVPAADPTSRRLGLADLLALAAVAALAIAIARGGSGSPSDPLPVLLVPLSALAAGVLAYRLAGAALLGAERLSRRGPLPVRLALVNLARALQAAALAVAFLTIAVALGGFAIVYRATLLRGVADQAADRVPLDAKVAAGPSFVTPLEAAPLGRWRALAGGDALPVDRTEASYPAAGQPATVPAIALPARGLDELHGWRASDASAPRSELASELRWPGPARNPGPRLPSKTRSLRAEVSVRGATVDLKAELRDPEGTVRSVALGPAAPGSHLLTGRVPPGRWELEAFGLAEPSGAAITNAHQAAEGGVAPPALSSNVRIGAVEAVGARAQSLRSVAVSGWRAVGAAGGAHPSGSGVALRFTTRGTPGVVRPVQPGDSRPLPVLTDPTTASRAAPGGRLELTVDGAPVNAHIAGVLGRFPTLPANAGGFVVADEAQLESSIDAAQPGAGRPNELWLSSPDSTRLRSALASPRFRDLRSSFRADIEHQLRTDPVASGILGGLIAAAAISIVICCLGLMVVLIGSGRDPTVERDLVAQGIGPRALRADLRLRAAALAGLGVVAGLIVAVALAGLAVGAVRAGTTLAEPRPPFVTVVPWLPLLAWTLLAGAGIAAAVALAGARPGRTR